MLSKPVVVGLAAIGRLFHTQDLGLPHPVLDALPVFHGPDADGELDLGMWAELGQAGLASRPGRVDGDVWDTLMVLAHPAVEYWAFFTEPDGAARRALVAGAGEEAVIVVRGDTKVWISSIPNRSLPETLIQQLPSVPAARIEAINLRRSVAGNGVLMEDALVHVQSDLATVRQLGSEPTLGLGELYVGVRDGWGRRRATTEPVRYRDSRLGRVMVSFSGDFVSIAPGTNTKLAEQLRAAHRELTN